MIDVAVVIPTYRRSEYVVEAVASVLGQTHPPAEVVVVCDGPGTVIPDSLRQAVRVIDQPHAGVAVARNTGLAATTASWVCFLDDDDLWHPERLARTAAYLEEHPDCGALTASSWTFASTSGPGIDLVADDLAGCLEASARTDPATATDMSYLDINGRSFELLLERNRGNLSGATIRRDLVEAAGGFPAEFSCAEEWLLFLNVARYTEWHFLDERLSFVRIHPGNNTATNRTNGLMIIRAFHHAWSDRSHPTPPHPALAEYGAAYRWNVQNLVWGSVRLGDVRIAWDTLREGVRLLPRTRDKAYVLVPPPITWRVEQRLGRAPGGGRPSS